MRNVSVPMPMLVGDPFVQGTSRVFVSVSIAGSTQNCFGFTVCLATLKDMT